MQQDQERLEAQRLAQAVERGRRAKEFRDSPGFWEFLGNWPERERLRLMDGLKALDLVADTKELAVAALTVKAGLEAADRIGEHLNGIIEIGEHAAYQLLEMNTPTGDHEDT